MSKKRRVLVYTGKDLARYAFKDHPFNERRVDIFLDKMLEVGLDSQVDLGRPVPADEEQIQAFHQADYVRLVKERSISGRGCLDRGDTPAFRGMFEAASYVVGTVLDAASAIIEGRAGRAFVPIAGLHHAHRDRASGFCVFNDCGVLIENLRRRFNIERVAYVDIDAHHGDGVYYAFASDPSLCIADIHEDGRYLFPGTGSVEETGTGPGQGSKLNIPLQPGAGDDEFISAWERVEAFIRAFRPEFIIFQCGADGLATDPITHLQYSTRVHSGAAACLCSLADEFCYGRLLALGGGGYNPDNIGRAWTAVVREFIS